jgi:uncharacterized protein YkwD
MRLKLAGLCILFLLPAVLLAQSAVPGVDAHERYLLELINKDRAASDVPELTLNVKLSAAAEGHNLWMLTSGSFSHTGEGGSTPGDRMKAAGYVFSGSWSWGENIAWGSTRSPSGYMDEVELLHRNLMNSAGHRANLLNANFKEIGLDLAIGMFQGRSAAMVTENFARSSASNGGPLIPTPPAPAPNADTTAPTVTLISPSSGSTVSAPVTLTAQASDNVKVVKVEFYRDGKLMKTDKRAPYNWKWQVRQNAGPHTFQAKAYDAVGNMGASATVILLKE